MKINVWNVSQELILIFKQTNAHFAILPIAKNVIVENRALNANKNIS